MKKAIYGLAGILALAASGCSQNYSPPNHHNNLKNYSLSGYSSKKKCQPCVKEEQKRIAIEKIKTNTPMSNEEMDNLSREDWLDIKETLGDEYKNYFGE
jgi:hypothetical protein